MRLGDIGEGVHGVGMGLVSEFWCPSGQGDLNQLTSGEHHPWLTEARAG